MALMRDRNVSDLVFRDLESEAATLRTSIDAERAAELREELDKLRPRKPGPRVVPAERRDAREDDTSASE